jgi:hypothetical protein
MSLKAAVAYGFLMVVIGQWSSFNFWSIAQQASGKRSIRQSADPPQFSISAVTPVTLLPVAVVSKMAGRIRCVL